MSWTVDPSVLLQSTQSTLGRPIPVFDTLLKIMATNLAPALQELGFPERTWPKAFMYAGEEMEGLGTRDRWPIVLVGGSIRTTDFGMGHQDEINAMLTCAWPVQLSRAEFQDALDVATVMRRVMRYPPFMGPCEDQDNPGRYVWNHCLPTGFRPVPANWPHYSGWIAEFLIVQTPNQDLWTVTA